MRSLSDKLGVKTVLYEFWGPVEGMQSLNEGGRSCSLPHPIPTSGQLLPISSILKCRPGAHRAPSSRL